MHSDVSVRRHDGRGRRFRVVKGRAGRHSRTPLYSTVSPPLARVAWAPRAQDWAMAFTRPLVCTSDSSHRCTQSRRMDQGSLMPRATGQYYDLKVTPCGTRFEIRKDENGAVRLPKILVLIIWWAVRMKGGENKDDAAHH